MHPLFPLNTFPTDLRMHGMKKEILLFPHIFFLPDPKINNNLRYLNEQWRVDLSKNEI